MTSFKKPDDLQTWLKDNTFSNRQSPKKTAGRFMGSLLEIFTYYLLRTWKHTSRIIIEDGIPEYGVTDITHNVEFSLNPILEKFTIEIDREDNQSITPNRIIKKMIEDKIISENDIEGQNIKTNPVITKENHIKNSCLLYKTKEHFVIANLISISEKKAELDITKLIKNPYMIVECKRVGVEDGMSKGPQTIEKAKQGSYVAKSVSSLQKVRNQKGQLMGVVFDGEDKLQYGPFIPFLQEIIKSNDSPFLRNLVLTVGIVSDHGNWFTANNLNKEMKVLKQSYDWLLFVSDKGVTQFYQDIIKIKEIKKCLEQTDYKEFSKQKLCYDAHLKLVEYFEKNIKSIESWLEIITDSKLKIKDLKDQIDNLSNKNWKEIHT
tara:strand:- start:737 stop:1867 length:1131 start_codon:yes stop_codon:yes gene_type:complete